MSVHTMTKLIFVGLHECTCVYGRECSRDVMVRSETYTVVFTIHSQ